MQKLIWVAGLGLACVISTTAGAGPQQDKMRTCNAEAKEKTLKGPERKSFMKDCLSKKADAPPTSDKAASSSKKAASPG